MQPTALRSFYQFSLRILALLLLLLPALYFIYSNKATGSERVAAARNSKDALLRTLFTQKGVNYPPQQLYIRVFKSENILEVWAANKTSRVYTHIKDYPVCAMSGKLGPKRKEGDEQVPEGFYHIGNMNPYSAYHLSMLVTYPNASDRLLSKHSRLGGDIYIHGNCVSIGCIAITNPLIEELYWLTAQVRTHSQKKVPIHIFPARLSNLKYNLLCYLYSDMPELLRFWAGLKQGYDWFEQHKTPPVVDVNASGFYQISNTNSQP